MVIAQLGRPGEPYIYLDVDREEKYSATLKKHFVHRVLCSALLLRRARPRSAASSCAPTIAATPEKLGTLISFVRFLFIAMQRRDFRDEILAELLPPLEPDGTATSGKRSAGTSRA